MVDWATKTVYRWATAKHTDRPKSLDVQFETRERVLLIIGTGGVLIRRPLLNVGKDVDVFSLLPIWMNGADAYRLHGLDDDLVSDDEMRVRKCLLTGSSIEYE